MPQNRRISAVDCPNPADIQPPDVPKKKRTSLVIPPPPVTSTERRNSEDKPRTPTSDQNRLPSSPSSHSSPAATGKGEHKYSNIPSPLTEPRALCDTSSMPPSGEAREQCDSVRPALSQHESCGSIVLDNFGYIECVP